MEAIELMGKYKARIDTALNDFLTAKLKEAVSPETKEMLELIKEFNLRGGKRIRPVLMIYGYKCFSECDEECERKLIAASIAIELMEAYLLIHDDIMDEDTLRRGGPTLNHRYAGLAGERYQGTDPKRFGDSMAILAGDIVASLGNDVLASCDFPAEKKVLVLKKFNDVIIKTCFGQVHDFLSEIKESTDEQDISNIQELKTAVYTIEGPLQIGAILAGAGKKELEMLSRFAIPVGKAFQIQDDIIGLFGKEERAGKPIGSDIREGKKTLLILKALEKASEKDKRTIKSCLGKKDLRKEDIKTVQQIVEDTGSLRYSKELSLKLIEEGKKEIERAKIRQEAKDFLLGIADYLANREF